MEGETAARRFMQAMHDIVRAGRVASPSEAGLVNQICQFLGTGPFWIGSELRQRRGTAHSVSCGSSGVRCLEGCSSQSQARRGTPLVF